MLRRTILMILLVLLPTVLFAQVSAEADQLREGLLLFKQEKYQDAIRAFRVLIFNKLEDREKTADAYYWISRSYLAINNFEEAARNIEYFLTNFPSHQYYPDALYQKGRLLYLQGDSENAVLVLEGFLKGYSDSPYIGSAYFWLGECLFSLGLMDEAARVFNQVVVEYPKSVKLEAARYRLSLIEYKKRENELLRLLKWSHEEALKSVEEFNRREKTYEQAIDAYQRKLSSAAGQHSEIDAPQVQKMQEENEALLERIRSLEAQLAARTDGESHDSAQIVDQRIKALENTEKALEMKAKALALKESLLLSLNGGSGSGQ